ncbi:hypothetical protein L9F63_019109 [Diploptera punctata]|uniref:CRAL-TRIO domain-containing protein n=1 Tax=Diploptera punctata TaxID=6984 RepID=A0AAD8EF25_DIPPU|nr:hypothetical protein L9F63_019109 [Diploptera punctata]
MDFLLPSPEVKQKVRKELGLDERTTKEAVNGIKLWLQQQPHLPKTEDDERLERWLIRCKNNMEKTKKTLDQYYSLKTLSPELMTDWNIDTPEFYNLINFCYGIVMPKLTSECDRVVISGFLTSDCGPITDWLLYKILIMSNEIRMCEDYYSREIIIFDMKNFTMAHLTKFGIPALKKIMVCAHSGYNVRIRGMHFVNAPAYAQTLISLIKKFLKKKLADRVHVHRTDFTELHKLVPKSCLPIELGGDCGTIKEHFDIWCHKLESYREWFLQQEIIKSDESKRPSGEMKSCDMFGFEGSFRQLAID